MKIFRLIVFASLGLAFPLYAIAAFNTPQDLVDADAASGIYLQNAKTQETTVYGLYVRQLAYVTPGGSCSSSTAIYNSATNKTVGGLVTPVTIKPDESASLGKNFLYNMLFQAFYYVGIIYPSSPPGCALPGCTWGSDTTKYDWCIYIGGLAPVSRSGGYTASVPPSTENASTGSYDYNLITSYITLGPIHCDDEALTCQTVGRQTQNFT